MNIKTLKLTVPYYIMTAVGVIGTSATAHHAEDTISKEETPKHITVAKDSMSTAPVQIDSISDVAARPQTVRELGRDVIYVYDNGDEVTRKKGSRAWRNNNPGNLRYTTFSRKEGAIGECGKYAVFPDEETGMNALRKLLATDTYQKLSMAAAIRKYSPEGDAGIARYISKLVKLTGLPQTTKLGSLNRAQLNMVAESIRSIEGWITGQEEQTIKANNISNIMLAGAKANAVRNAVTRSANERTL